jgi:hypothetical protein
LEPSAWPSGASPKHLRLLGRIDEALTTQQMLLADYEAADQTDGYVF